MKKILLSIVAGAALLLAGCNQADIASHNLSKAADRFEVNRRIVFFNGITDKYLMVVEGLCSLGNQDKHRELTVTCKTGPEAFKKHFFGLSDNVSFFVEQLAAQAVSTYHYKVLFRPQTIIPDIDVDVDIGAR